MPGSWGELPILSAARWTKVAAVGAMVLSSQEVQIGRCTRVGSRRETTSEAADDAADRSRMDRSARRAVGAQAHFRRRIIPAW